MSSNKVLVVAQYGHPKLPGSKHWALLIMNINDKMTPGTAYEITGSTTTYTLKTPEVVTPGKASSFMGMIPVGTIPEIQLKYADTILRNTAVRTGDKTWHCQHWVMDALDNLRRAGLPISTVTHESLLAQFGAMM
ncbi:hypothetical protein CC2G_013693 [Coprinopsis cinerea AmutBmut pab1-1]|nr:hypothetical protein CC2G_013693 [Coprinopsis cinerea AmutBmut pab1-1]